AARLAQLDEPDAALLDEPPLRRGRAARGEPPVRGPEGRVAGEGQLGAGGEDPHPVVGGGVGRREEEGGLGEVRPRREALHLLGGQPLPVDDDGDRVALVGLGPEHVHLEESPLQHARTLRRGLSVRRRRLAPWRASWPRRRAGSGSPSSTTTPPRPCPSCPGTPWPSGRPSSRPPRARAGCGPTPRPPTAGCCAPVYAWNAASPCACAARSYAARSTRPRRRTCGTTSRSPRTGPTPRPPSSSPSPCRPRRCSPSACASGRP